MATHYLALLLVWEVLLLQPILSVEIYMREELDNLNSILSTYSLTDGTVHVRATGDNSKQVIYNCQVSDSEHLVTLLKQEQYRATVTELQWRSLLKKCDEQNKANALLDSYSSGFNRLKREVKWVDQSTARPNFIPEGNKLGNALILNGTIWCGTGNKASSFDQLGYYADVDQCCRAHDYCPEFIPMLTTRYKYSNLRPYTISHCRCDYQFYRCLKATGSKKADEVGDFFFYTVAVPCFNFEYGEYCADESSFLFCSNPQYGSTVTLNYVLSNIWHTAKSRVTLLP